MTTGRELGQYLHRRVTTFPGSTQIPDVGAFELDDRGDIGTATRHVTPFQIELTAAQAAKKSVRVVLRKAGFRVLDRTIDMAKFTDGDTRMTAELDERLAPLPPVTRPPLGPPR